VKNKILITCTAPRAQDYVTTLLNTDDDAIAMPALQVTGIRAAIPEGDFEGMVVTSAHAFMGDLPDDLPIIAVGDETASLAWARGFTVIHSGHGGIMDLDLTPYRRLLYPCAPEPTACPPNCISWPVYQTHPNPDFRIPADITIICVFSVKAAQVIRKHPLHDKIILCLSDKIAAQFDKVRCVKLAVADTPRYDAMISLIHQVTGEKTDMTYMNGLKDVETLINRFGGMRPMARKLNVAVSTIQGWKKRDHIPADRMAEVIAAAREHHVSLDGLEADATPATELDHTAQSDPVTPAAAAAVASPARPRSSGPMQQQQHNGYGPIDAAQIRRDSVMRSVFTTVSVVAVLGGLGWFLFGQEAEKVTTALQHQDTLKTQVTTLQSQFESFESTLTDGLNALNDQMAVMADQTLPLSDRIAGLEGQLQSATGEKMELSALVGRFENLANVVNGQGGNTEAAFADLKEIIGGLQSRVDMLDTSLEQAKADNAELASSMENVSGRDISAAAMLLAMTQMRDSMNRAEPFADDLALLQQLVGQDDPELTAAINRLAPYAESGILTPEGLSSELRGVSGDIIAAALRGEDVSIQDHILARIGQILSVEKDGQPLMGIEEQAVIARAQAALERGDVTSALTELKTLEGEAASAANPLTDQLQGAVSADETISMMMKTLIDKLQNPQSLQNYIQTLPQQIERQMQGDLYQDDASGIVILE